ncbi:hypothetical protein VPH35_087672 [Triticum aestivum]|uniref:Gamma-tubulin complex component n=1 Tax=Triticum aestivum TaxID=4565 RepID=A0A3B6LFF4_WHEAT|nr:uncharacterized protein LOC123110117 [Triticum aestivum]
MAPSAAGETPPPEPRWLAALSEPELDLLVSLKLLAVKLAETAGRPHLAAGFDLRTLRALSVVLLEDFKSRSEETSVDASVSVLDRLALSRECATDGGGGSTSDSEVFRRGGKDEAKPNSVKRKRKQMQDGRHGETVQSKKKRKLGERR